MLSHTDTWNETVKPEDRGAIVGEGPLTGQSVKSTEKTWFLTNEGDVNYVDAPWTFTSFWFIVTLPKV